MENQAGKNIGREVDFGLTARFIEAVGKKTLKL